MFHRQLRGRERALRCLRRGADLAGSRNFSTAFAANVATNVWLGFPFMMVVTVGALTARSRRTCYEAAEVDGAGPLAALPPRGDADRSDQRSCPAVALGSVWTFNMFNVVFLVSGR
jgi:arabinogalactan oligomer/maltooligosaccharide transport system permease protein